MHFYNFAHILLNLFKLGNNTCLKHVTIKHEEIDEPVLQED